MWRLAARVSPPGGLLGNWALDLSPVGLRLAARLGSPGGNLGLDWTWSSGLAPGDVSLAPGEVGAFVKSEGFRLATRGVAPGGLRDLRWAKLRLRQANFLLLQMLVDVYSGLEGLSSLIFCEWA